jgi:hypothetical protein
MPEPSTRWHISHEAQPRHSSISETHEQNAPADADNSEDEHDGTGHANNWIVKAGLLGASSSASFIRSICRAVGGNEMPRSDKPAPAVTSHLAPGRVISSGVRLRAINTHSAEYVLPPRKRADRLLEVHWGRSHIPWTDRLRVMHWYKGLWSGRAETNRDVDEQIYHCILNIIFAISYTGEDFPELDPVESQRLSQAHFSRAQKLLSFNLLDISYIGLVQALLVMIQYFQSTNMTRQCFQCTGLAILVAQNLGLHLPHTTSRIRSQYDREMARRAWHGCILVDRITSMIYSQPMRISQEVARQSSLPAAIDDEYLADGDVEGSQPPDRPSQLQFFREFCKLHIILGDILSTFYAGRSTTNHDNTSEHASASARPHIDQIMHFDKALDDWFGAVNTHLRVKPDFQVVNNDFKGQALNLHARFLHIRLLLYRTFFSQKTSELLEQQQPMLYSIHQVQPFADTIGFQGLLTCVRIAQQLLQLISSNIDESQPSRQGPAWWHVISYVYSAVTVLIAAYLFPFVVEQISTDKLNASIKQGFGILEHYTSDKKPAQRCKAALTVLCEKMTLASSIPKYTPSGTVIPPHPNLSDIDRSGSDLAGDLSSDLAWSDIIGSSDLFIGENDSYWLYAAPFDQESTSLWPGQSS